MNAQTRIQRGETLSLALEMVSGDLTGATCAMSLKRSVNGKAPADDAPVLIDLNVVYVPNLVAGDGQSSPGWIGTGYGTEALEPDNYSADARIVFDGRVIQAEKVTVVIDSRVTSGTPVTAPEPVPGSDIATASGRPADEPIVLRWRTSSKMANPAAAVIAPPSSTVANRIAFDDTLTALGVTNVQDAIVALYALLGSTPPVVTPVLLSGALMGSSALAGALSITRALSGQATGSGVLTASLTVEREGLSGTVVAAGLLTGSLQVTRALIGAIEGTSAVAGALSVTRALSGTAYGMGAMTGALTVDATPEEVAYVLFVNGQSNSVVENTANQVPADLVAAIPGAQIWQPFNNTWATYQAGVNSYFAVSAPPVVATADVNQAKLWGPEARFAKLWTANNPGKDLYIIKTGKGSTALQEAARTSGVAIWDPTKTDEMYAFTKTAKEAAFANLVAAGKTPRVIGNFWMQGENDAGVLASANNYEVALTAFRAQHRSEVMAASPAPFVIGRIRTAWAFASTVRAAQLKLSAQPNNRFIDTDAYTLSDGVHYAAASVDQMGTDLYTLLTPALWSVPTATASLLASFNVGFSLPFEATIDYADFTSGNLGHKYTVTSDKGWVTVTGNGTTDVTLAGTAPASGDVATITITASNALGQQMTVTRTITAAAVAWSPATAPTVRNWWSPRDSSTVFTDTSGTTPAVAGNTVRRLNDKKGSANLTEPTNAPTLLAVSGRNVVKFTAASLQKLETTDAALMANMNGINKPYTMITVVERGSGDGAFFSFNPPETGDNHYNWIYIGGGGEIVQQRQGSAGQVQGLAPGGSLPSTPRAVITVCFTGTNLIIRKNGVQLINNAFATTGTLTVGKFAWGVINPQSGADFFAFNGQVEETLFMTSSSIGADVIEAEKFVGAIAGIVI